jgi:hypothetical protein
VVAESHHTPLFLGVKLEILTGFCQNVKNEKIRKFLILNGLGGGLQNRTRRFESARNLTPRQTS